MAVLFLLVLASLGVIVLLVSIASPARRSATGAPPQLRQRVSPPPHRLEQQRRVEAHGLQAAYGNLQLALAQLQDAPDFRRAASRARLAGRVPLAFRQRQFQRFRPQLLLALVARLRADMPMAQAAGGLEDLVTALGIARFEAEYLITEAQRQVADRVLPSPTFAEKIREQQAAYQRRIHALRALPGLDPELREQLLELEYERLREQLVRQADQGHDQRLEL